MGKVFGHANGDTSLWPPDLYEQTKKKEKKKMKRMLNVGCSSAVLFSTLKMTLFRFFLFVCLSVSAWICTSSHWFLGKCSCRVCSGPGIPKVGHCFSWKELYTNENPQSLPYITLERKMLGFAQISRKALSLPWRVLLASHFPSNL